MEKKIEELFSDDIPLSKAGVHLHEGLLLIRNGLMDIVKEQDEKIAFLEEEVSALYKQVQEMRHFIDSEM